MRRLFVQPEKGTKVEYESFSRENTFEIGRRLAADAKPGEVYTLSGDLGAGKTVFVKGFADGLGITSPVTSPTFTILQVYEEGRLPLYHYDVYRITDPGEMDEIGFDDFIAGRGVSMIEWPEQIEDILPQDRIKVSILRDLSKGLDYRKIIITGSNEA